MDKFEKSSTTIFPLTVSGANLFFGATQVLHDINCRLEFDGLTIVLGHNGAGKSLLLKLCHGLIKPTNGSVQWTDTSLAMRAGEQAMVFHRPTLLGRSVIENLAYVRKRRCSIDPLTQPHRIEDALALVCLEDKKDHNAWQLSAGQQQRLAIACAWIMNPQVIFMDEPCSNLDPASTALIETIVNNIKDHCKIIMTTHDLNQARRIADDVVFMYQGQLLEQTKAALFFKQATTEQAQRFLKGELV